MEHARGRKINFSILTLGCKLNQYESELMREKLENLGFKMVPLSPMTDLLVVNTCAVTRESERKSRQLARRGKRLKRDMKVVVVGCSPQIDHHQYLEFADSILGNVEKKSIDEYVMDIMNGKKLILVGKEEITLEDELHSFENRTRVFLKIEDGCDGKCTYCIIRKARGERIRSKKSERVIREFENFSTQGVKEVVLTGLNLGRYGKDTGENLRDLIEKLMKIHGNFRIRLSSINPEDLSDDLIHLFEEKKLCRHLHLPIQSGSDKVLRAMGRRYRICDILEKVEKLRSLDSLFSLTTDVMIGFPGETDEDFERTLDLIERVNFLKVHIFRFSPRPGTPAMKLHKLEGVDEGKVKERFKILNEVSLRVRNETVEKHVGRIRCVLVERMKDGRAVGFDEYYIPHEIDSNGSNLELNEFFKVRIGKVTRNGKVVSSRIADLPER